MKKLIAALWLIANPALAANYASPTFNNITTTGNITANSGKILAVVPTDAALKALPLTGFSAGTVVQDTGYYADGDMPAVEYSLQTSACSLNSGSGDGGSQIPSNTSGNCWVLTPVKSYDVRTWGVKADNSTDNTSTLSNAIAYSETSTVQGSGSVLILPPGQIVSGPQTISGQIAVKGQNSASSVLKLKSGSTSPLLTVNLTGSSYSNGQAAVVKFSDFRLTSQDGNSLNATEPNADGIRFAGNSVETWAYIDNINVVNMPGNGVTGIGPFNGFVHFYALISSYNGGNGWSTNSTADWSVDDSQIYENLQNGILSSGDGALYIHNMNSFYNNLNGGYFYGSEYVTIDGHGEFNGNVQAGIELAGVTQPSGSPGITIGPEVGFGGNSRTSPNSYPAILVNSGSATVSILGETFAAPYAVNSSNSENYNIQFTNSSTVHVFCSVCNYYAGGPANAYVTNAPSQLTSTSPNTAGNGWLQVNPLSISDTSTSGTNTLAVSATSDTNGVNVKLTGNGSTTPTKYLNVTSGTFNIENSADNSSLLSLTDAGVLTTADELKVNNGGESVTASAQYGGIILSNGTNNIAAIQGNSSTNDYGQLALFAAGTATVRLSAGNGVNSFINSVLTLGNGSSNAAPISGTLQGTAGSGTNIAGADLNIAGGQGTGTGTSGGMQIKAAAAGTSGSSANALSNYFRVDSTGATIQNGALIFKTTPYTVSTLPTCNSTTAWYVYPVSDASSPTWNGTLSGGGSTKVLALCNGSNWVAQ